MSPDWAEMRQLSGQGFLSDTEAPRRNWLEEYIHPDDEQQVLAAIQKAVGEKSMFELEHRAWRLDGTLAWTLSRAVPLLDGRGEITEWFGAASDVTRRKQAEEALKESEQRLASALHAAELGAWELDLATGKAWRSPQHDHIFGYEAFLPEWSYGVFLEHVHAEDRAAVDQGFREALSNGGTWSFECRIRRADRIERWISAQGKMDLNAEGQPIRMKGTVRDITELKQAEEDLRRSYRELEEFAYVASHDLQEPLRMVNIYTQLIVKRVKGSDATLNEYADFVRKGATRMDALIRDLLTYSRTVHRERLPIGTADLRLSLREAISVLQSRIEESGAKTTATHLPQVSGNTKQLAHVFQNLVSNALKYRRLDIAPEIEIAAERDGPEWLVSVRDNGIGFEPQYAERIFGLFKRLHADEYPGTGLGLAICQRIIQRYGGRLWAEGRPGHGATFFFALPQAAER